MPSYRAPEDMLKREGKGDGVGEEGEEEEEGEKTGRKLMILRQLSKKEKHNLQF